jgi:parvulin-like peptidyl-prolyl isomerase
MLFSKRAAPPEKDCGKTLPMRRLPLLIPLAVALAFVVAGCGSSSSVPSDAVAKVGGETITKAQFDAVVEQAKAAYKLQKRAFPRAGTPDYLSLQGQIVQYLVERVEFEQKGKDLGIVVSDKDVQTRIDQIKQQYYSGSDSKFRAALAAQGRTEEGIRPDVKAQILSERLFSKVTASTTVTNAAVAAYYQQHKSLYGQPESRTVRHILVKSKALADKLYNQLRNGASFAALAKKYSEDPGSRAAGGTLKIAKGQTVPQFDRVAFSLKVNELSRPVHTQFGWHVIQALTPIAAATSVPLSTVSPQVKAQLLQTKRNEEMTAWVSDVKKSFASKIHYQKGYAPASATTTTTPATTTG